MINKQKAAYWIGLVIIALAIAFFILAVSSLGNATTTKPRENGLGVVISNIDPNDALVGSIVSGELHQDKDGRLGTSIRVHPKATYAMFDEAILFCGDESGALSLPDGTILKGNYAFTYRRAASRVIDGVSCHALISVDKLEVK
jgi:hypothetical protein